jgi:hypothetical protein
MAYSSSSLSLVPPAPNYFESLAAMKDLAFQEKHLTKAKLNVGKPT